MSLLEPWTWKSDGWSLFNVAIFLFFLLKTRKILEKGKMCRKWEKIFKKTDQRKNSQWLVFECANRPYSGGVVQCEKGKKLCSSLDLWQSRYRPKSEIWFNFSSFNLNFASVQWKLWIRDYQIRVKVSHLILNPCGSFCSEFAVSFLCTF